MANVELRLRQYGKVNPKGWPICFYIRYQGKPYYRRTGYFALDGEWNHKRNVLKSSHPKAPRLQNYLTQEVLDLHIALEAAERERLSFEQALNSAKGAPSFSEHFEERIGELHQAGDLGNKRVYEAQLKWLRNYLGKQDIEFSEINFGTLQRLIAFCDGLGNSYNTIRQRLQTIKAVYKNGMKRYPKSVIPQDFSGLLEGRAPTRIKKHQDQHQPIEDVVRVMLHKPKNKGQEKALDVWKLAFLMQGAGIIDMIYLPDSIGGSHYELKRLKMPKKDIVIKVHFNELSLAILNRYYDYPPKKGKAYLFDLARVPRDYKDVLPGKKQPEGSRLYENARTNIDRRLKQISKDLGLKKPLSMIQARHSWVIIARDLGFPRELIEQCIGHKGQSVMDKHYFGKYNQKEIDKVNVFVERAVVNLQEGFTELWYKLYDV